MSKQVSKKDSRKEALDCLILKIGQWAYDELGYSDSAKRPTIASQCSIFKDLCKGSNGKIWESVVLNVKRSGTFNNAITDENRRSEKVKQLSELQDHTIKLDFDLMQESNELEKLEQEYATIQQGIDKFSTENSHLRCMLVLLETKKSQFLLEIKKLTQMKDKLLDSVHPMKKLLKDESLTITSTCKKKNILTQSTISILDDLEKQTYSLCLNHASNSSKDDDSKIKQKVVFQVFDLLKSSSLKIVLMGLGIHAQNAIDNVSRLAQSSGITEDYKELGFSYEPLTINTVTEMAEVEDQCMEDKLANLRSKHMEFEADYKLLGIELETLLLQQKSLKNKLKGLIADSKKREMILTLCNMEFAIADAQTKLSSLKNVLSSEEDQIALTQQNLEENLEKIQQSEQLIHQKHFEIISTMASNSEMRQAIWSCFNTLQETRDAFSDINMCSLLTSVDIWKENIARGTELFSDLKNKSLLSLLVKGSCPLSTENPYFCEIKKSLNVSTSNSIESLLKQALKKKTCYDTGGQMCTQQLDFINELKNVQTAQQTKLDAYAKCLNEFDNEVTHVLPIIEEELTKIPTIECNRRNVEEQFKIWSTLPAFHVEL